ncbi:uncharacterized protein [Malus domestica]|uniref:uncharacterized protein isoform X3 n=1 Tax=Malus domestica TaxID=3750 RepID=UPI0039767CA5
MAGREVREYTNLTDPKDKKWGKGKDKIDDEDITFQRMVAKMQEVAGERGGYLHGRGGTLSPPLSPPLMCIQGTHNNYIKHLCFYFSTCVLEALNPQVDSGTRQPILNLCICLALYFIAICCKFACTALDSDDLLYLKEQMEAEEDAERLLRRTEKRAFAAFKISFY